MYKMTVINNEKLETIEGGQSITGTLVNAFTSAGKLIFDIGKSLGSSMRRIFSRNLCQIL